MSEYIYEYQHPALTVDCVVFGFDGKDICILLVKRAIEPFKGEWALPGGFIHLDETLEQAARRELEEETGLSNVYMEQLYTFGDLDRDPRERVVTVAYYALVRASDYQPVGATDAEKANWFKIAQLPCLAFDHNQIISLAFNRIKGQIRYQPIGFELLGEKFTMSQLQQLYEAVLQKKLDRRNFSSKILKTGIIELLNEKVANVPHRAPRLIRFNKQKYNELISKGFNFEI